MNDLLESWKRSRAEAHIPPDFTERVMRALPEEGTRRPARPALAVAAVVTALAALAARMYCVLEVFVV